MALYDAAVRTTNTTISNASVELRSAATNKPRVMEWGFAQVTGTASSYGFGRPAAIGVTPGGTASLTPQENSDPASLSVTALSWATSPTAPTVYSRRYNTPATVGAGAIWIWPAGYGMAVSSSVVQFNVTATVACDVWLTCDE